MWQRFCRPACRRAATKEDMKAEYSCEYCGIVSDTVDHIPPTSIRPTLIELNLQLIFPFIEVRACRECNSTLSDRGLWTVELRRQCIAERLARRYRTYLEIPDWSQDELNTLDDRLRALTVQGLAVRDLTRLRIARAREEVSMPVRVSRPMRTVPELETVSTRHCLTCGTPTHDDDYCSIACHPEHRPADWTPKIKPPTRPLTKLERQLARTEQRIAQLKRTLKTP